MEFNVRFIRSAEKDLDYYSTYEQKLIVKAIIKYLQIESNIETKKRKRLRPNPIAPWELRIGMYRVFYEIKDNNMVRALAIGHKEHNDLFIRGERVEL